MKSTLQILSVFFILIITTSSSFAEHIRYQEVSNAGMSYELVIETKAPDVLKPLPFKINVSTPDGDPIAEAQITCSLTMPAMAMPNNKPPISRCPRHIDCKCIHH